MYVRTISVQVGGNLYDAVSIAVKAALLSTRVPRVSVTAVDGGQPEIEVLGCYFMLYHLLKFQVGRISTFPLSTIQIFIFASLHHAPSYILLAW